MVAKAPDLIEQIDRQVEILTASNSSKSPQSNVSQVTSHCQQIDRTPFRRQVNSLLCEELRNIEYYYSEEPFSGTLNQEVEKAKQFIEARDSFRAFMMLYAIAEGLSDHVDDIEEYCDLSDIVVCMLIQMNRFNEAIAAAELIQNEQKSFTIAKKLLECGLSQNL